MYTQPALGASQTGAENAIWALKRSRALPDCSNTRTSISVANNIAKGDYCEDNSVAVTLNVKEGTPYVFYLYDPDPQDGNPNNPSLFDLLNMEPTYDTLTVNYLSGSAPTTSVSVRVERLDGTLVGNQLQLSASIPNGLIGGLRGINDEDNRMRVTLTSSNGNATVDVLTEPGLPDISTLDAVGCAGPQISSSTVSCGDNADLYQRRLQVTVPN